jgi:hypothetical protein
MNPTLRRILLPSFQEFIMTTIKNADYVENFIIQNCGTSITQLEDSSKIRTENELIC